MNLQVLSALSRPRFDHVVATVRRCRAVTRESHVPEADRKRGVLDKQLGPAEVVVLQPELVVLWNVGDARERRKPAIGGAASASSEDQPKIFLTLIQTGLERKS